MPRLVVRWSSLSNAIQVVERNCNVKELLAADASGVYTTMRTICQGRRLAEVEAHRLRLVHSAQLAFDDATVNIPTHRLLEMSQKAIPDHPRSDYRITVIVRPVEGEQRGMEMLAVSEEIPCVARSVQVDVQCLTRPNPSIKSTDWARRRQTAENAKRSASDEVILADVQGHLYEGLSSNFAIIRTVSGSTTELVTAPDATVLPGTIMRVVKQTVRQLDITLVERLPTVNDLRECEAAFITSTSRLLLPIHNLLLPDRITEIKVNSTSSRMLARLQRSLEDTLISNSVPLFDS